jgi:pilus assembly protein CpaB
MGRRTVLLIAALVVAALGTTLIFVYVNNAEARAVEGAEPVEVLVATQQVNPGTTAGAASEDGAFELKAIPKEATVVGSTSDISDFADQSALATIYPGQQVLPQMFGDPQSVSDLQVGKGKLAMSVSLGDPERVAGFVVPGSDVAIFATLPTTDGAGDEATGVLIPSVEVIGVGASTLSTQTTTTDEGEQTTEEIPLAILTLEVDQQQAQKIINAQSGGSLYVALRGEAAQVRNTKPILTQELFR